MDLELSPEQEELRATLRRFLSDRASLSGYVRPMIEDHRGVDHEVWCGLSELGVTGLLVPEQLGGAGRGMVEMGVVLSEMGRMVHPGPFLSSAVGAVSAVAAAATDEQRSELLPALANGSEIGTIGLFERGSRRRWETPLTEAVEKDGGGWVLSGTKVRVPDAQAATLLLVVAAAPDGLGLFAVAPGSDGVAITPTPSSDGTRKQATVQMNGTPAKRLGGPDVGRALEEVADRVLVAYVADGLGAAERALEMSVEYARERTQFQRPIGSFQAVAHLCAEMLESVELARSGVQYALWAADSADPATRHRAATMAKAYAAESLPVVAANAIQIFGGIGYTWEHDIHLYYKRLLTLQQIHGPVSEHLEELARLIV